MDRDARPLPRFFLAEPPDGSPSPTPAPARLLPEEAEHARRVLRLTPGDRAVGLDGEGHAWPLVALGGGGRTGRAPLAFAVDGTLATTPGYGEPGSPLPWIEVAVAWPRKARAEEMIGRLVQLGAAAITPLAARFSGAEPCPAEAPARWEKLAREACKQSRRTWLPRFEPPATPAVLGARRRDAFLAVLEPAGGMGLDTWLRSLVPGQGGAGSRARPIVLVIGPEGGFAPDEREALLAAGATAVLLGPHVLRIETAAEAALAVAACTLLARHG